MSIGNHDEGFEETAEFKKLFHEMHRVLLTEDVFFLPYHIFQKIAGILAPQICTNVNIRKPCRRKLRYIAYDSWPEPIRSELNARGSDYFEYGEIYISTDFNGATYSIEGYSDGIKRKLIGCVYFEWLKDDDEATS